MSLGSVESPKPLTLRTLDISGSIQPLDVSGIEQSGLHLSTFFDSLKGPSAFTRVSDSQEYPSISGPLPPVLLNRFDKLSQSLYPEFAESLGISRSQYPLELPPSPKTPNSLYVSEVSIETETTIETQAVETQAVETQASVDVKDAVVQTLVGENRLEVPRLR
jgi:hypothetical protein